MKNISYNCQIGASHARTAKNLAMSGDQHKDCQRESIRKVEGRTEGKIISYVWFLRKRGLKVSSIKHYACKLMQLAKLGVNLTQPEEIKAFLADCERWSERTKSIYVAIYDGFLKFQGLDWKPPKYSAVEKLPLIPLESEIDQLISACGKKLAVFLQLLKETGMRCGEAGKLEWIDLDLERRTVRTTPEKGSSPRILPISPKLIAMLNNAPKTMNRVFPASPGSIKANFYVTRKRIARKLGNPRLLKISFHTLRHWKGTMEYHKTKDIIHVQRVLGHRCIDSTMIYINLEQAMFNCVNDEFHVKVAKNVEETCKLVEAGFEYITAIDGVQVFRKRK